MRSPGVHTPKEGGGSSSHAVEALNLRGLEAHFHGGLLELAGRQLALPKLVQLLEDRQHHAPRWREVLQGPAAVLPLRRAGGMRGRCMRSVYPRTTWAAPPQAACRQAACTCTAPARMQRLIWGVAHEPLRAAVGAYDGSPGSVALACKKAVAVGQVCATCLLRTLGFAPRALRPTRLS